LRAAVQAAVDEIAARSQLVVVLSHLGLDADRELVRGTTGLDLVLGGHQHIVTAEPEWEGDCATPEIQEQRGCSPRRVPIVHSGAYARWLSRLQLTLAPDPTQPTELELETLSLSQLPLSAAVPASPRVVDFLEEHRPLPAPPLGFLPVPVRRRSALAGDSALGDLTAEALLSMTAADVVVLNSSGLRADLEAGALLRSDLELAFPFDEPWRLVWLTGGALRRGLEQSARRSATRDCESALQVAGLRLQIRCGACQAGGSDCLRVERPTPLGPKALGDDQSLLVVLPAYLTLPGGDFEVVGTTGSEVEAVIDDLFARYLGTLPRLKQLAPCRESLATWSPLRCREGFGAEGCPLNEARAQAVCRALPNVEAARDGRIEMRP